IFDGAIERVVSVEREPLAARLKVLKTKRNLRLAGAHAKLALLIEIEVEIKIAKREGVHGPSRHGDDVDLKIERDVLVEVRRKDEACSADGETISSADGAIALMVDEIGIGARRRDAVVSKLGITAQLKALEEARRLRFFFFVVFLLVRIVGVRFGLGDLISLRGFRIVGVLLSALRA